MLVAAGLAARVRDLMESTSERLMDEAQRPAGQNSSADGCALTDEQWHVLNEAAESALLVSAVNSWGEPTPNLKIKAGYAPRIAAAAESLIEAGLIDVYEEPAGPGESPRRGTTGAHEARAIGHAVARRG